MPATTNGPDGLALMQSSWHPRCWVCSPVNPIGLGIAFEVDATGAVEGTFPCDERFTGYSGFLHGGVTSSLLDGAMTNCLLARGIPGVTADLQVRFLCPVLIGKPVKVRGWWDRSRGPVHIMGAELRQEGEVVATAVAKFMHHPDRKRPDRTGGRP